METIQFLNYSPKQLQGEITASVKTQLEEFLKIYKPKEPYKHPKKSKNIAKKVEIILSSIYKLIVIAQIIEPFLLYDSHYDIIHFFYYVLYIFVKNHV